MKIKFNICTNIEKEGYAYFAWYKLSILGDIFDKNKSFNLHSKSKSVFVYHIYKKQKCNFTKIYCCRRWKNFDQLFKTTKNTQKPV